MATETSTESRWTIKRLLDWTSDYLTNTQADNPRLSAEILLAHVLDCQRIDLYVKFDECPDPNQLACFRDLVKRCSQSEPVAYLIGKAHFYSLELAVTPAVLIPRPETELLVSHAIDFARTQTHRPTVDVLDLCTGSGCVAIALAANVVEAEIIAVDTSDPALQIARQNIEKHDLQGRVTLCQSDLFADVEQTGKAVFDLIIANPPYIAADQFAQLAPAVRDHEPSQALLAGQDGLDYHRRIIEQAEPYLASDGALMVELAYDQADAVLDLFTRAGYLDRVSAAIDSLGHRRVVMGHRKFK